ncbi:hypothetical protein HDU93_008161 [Gonapodya sp. JEL0774]|nr:hypothetical protein HDU93_008161 [Gonapodya sp. JEL0774]
MSTEEPITTGDGEVADSVRVDWTLDENGNGAVHGVPVSVSTGNALSDGLTDAAKETAGSLETRQTPPSPSRPRPPLSLTATAASFGAGSLEAPLHFEQPFNSFSFSNHHPTSLSSNFTLSPSGNPSLSPPSTPRGPLACSDSSSPLTSAAASTTSSSARSFTSTHGYSTVAETWRARLSQASVGSASSSLPTSYPHVVPSHSRTSSSGSTSNLNGLAASSVTPTLTPNISSCGNSNPPAVLPPAPRIGSPQSANLVRPTPTVLQPPGRTGRGKPKVLSLSQLGVGSTLKSAFANFSQYIDPNGKLNFSGKAVLHRAGVEFQGGHSYRIEMSELTLLEELGKGQYGTVRRVRHEPTMVEMAMKEIRLELDQSKLDGIVMELDVLHKSCSPYIVDFYGAFFVESTVYYCMEYMDAGSMDKLETSDGVPEDVLARIVWSVVKGLQFLKDELSIIHRDVKPTNILMNTKGEVKLCDFGVSGQLEKSLAKTNIGCQPYMAPERINPTTNSSYTVSSDVWSLGLSIVEMGLGRYPYPPENSVFAQINHIVEGKPPELPSDRFSEECRDFVKKCLDKVPSRRPTYRQLLAHPWLNRFDSASSEGDTGGPPDRVDLENWAKVALERYQAGEKRPKEEQAGTEAVQIV